MSTLPEAPTKLLPRRPTFLGKRKSTSYSVLFTDSLIYGGGRAVNMFFTALMLPLFTSLMSASDYGIVGMVVTVTTFLDIFVTLGFDMAFARFYYDSTEPLYRNKVVTHVFYVDFVYPAILLGILLAFMPQIAQLVMGAPGYTLYFTIGVGTLFFQNLSDLPFQLMRLDRRPWTFTWFVLARVAIQIPMTVVFLAVFHWGPAGYLGANLVTAILLNIGALPFYVRRLVLLWDWVLMKSMLAFAIPAMFTAVSFYFLKLSDRFFLLHYQGKAEVGLYTVANSLAQPLYIVGMAFRMAWPQWHYVKLNEPERHRRMVARSSTYFMAVNALLLAVVAVYLPLGMHVMLSSRYWSIGPTTFVLTLSVALYNLYFIFWAGSNVAKKNRLIPLITLIASGANVGLNFLLVPTYGMWAAAWTTVVGFAILAFLIYFYSERYYHIPFEWRRLIVLTVASTLTIVVAWAIGLSLGVGVHEPLDRLVVGELAMTPSFAVFVLVLWVGRFFAPEETARMRRVWGRIRRRPATVPAVAAAGASAAAITGPTPGRDGSAPQLGAGGHGDALVEHDLELDPEEAELSDEEEAEMESEVDVAEGGHTLA